MRDHEWVGLATAFMDDDMAAEWVAVDGLAGTGLALRIPEVICIVCGVQALDALEVCPGTTHPYHRWISTLTVSLDGEEVAHWLGDEEMELRNLPRSNGLTCAICGQPYANSDPECPERVLYAKGVSA